MVQSDQTSQNAGPSSARLQIWSDFSSRGEDGKKRKKSMFDKDVWQKDGKNFLVLLTLYAIQGSCFQGGILRAVSLALTEKKPLLHLPRPSHDGRPPFCLKSLLRSLSRHVLFLLQIKIHLNRSPKMLVSRLSNNFWLNFTLYWKIL